MLKQILQGVIVGIANIIPGVSGGTMMVAMGLYDKLIHAITHLKSEFQQSLKLLLPIFLGVGIAIVTLSRLLEYLLEFYPIPTNFAFCGLIAGGLPFIAKKVRGHRITAGRVLSFLFFFFLVLIMVFIGDAGREAADVSFNIINILKLFVVGIVAAATMVIPGVSGSMMLMLLGYYDTILKTINRFIDGLLVFDMNEILQQCGILIPFGIGVVVGVFLIAKMIEFVFLKAEIHAYCAIIGLILSSPIVILMNTDWSRGSVWMICIGLVTFTAGWIVANKLGEK